MFHRTARLLQHACKITLFTRPGCSLCDDAKGVLSKVWDQKPFHYSEINVLEDQNQKWKAVYEFDTPVIHVDKTPAQSNEETSLAAKKLMHRFKEDDVKKLMNEAEQDKSQS